MLTSIEIKQLLLEPVDCCYQEINACQGFVMIVYYITLYQVVFCSSDTFQCEKLVYCTTIDSYCLLKKVSKRT